MELCNHYDFRAVVLISPAMGFCQVMPYVFPDHLPHKKFLGIYDSSEKIAKIHSPVLIICGDKDELVSFEQGKKLFQRANPPKLFYWVRGARHTDIYEIGGEKLFKKMKSFIGNPGSR